MSAWVRAGDDFGQPSRLQRLGPAIPFLVIALALLAGIVAGRTTAPRQAMITRHVPLSPGSTHVESGVPTGYQHTSAGAVDAATNYAVAFNGPLLLDRATLRGAISAVASPDSRNALE